MREHHRKTVQHAARWLRSPKGLFAGVLLLLTLPAAAHVGWGLILPRLASAIATAILLDWPLLRWRDGKWSIPDGALLTGWLVGVILSPHVAWPIVAATAALSIGAKHLLRVRRANVLNPAAAGVVLSYYLFDTGQSWWGALPERAPVWIVLVIITAGFMAWRLHKLPVVLTFMGVHLLLATGLAYTANPMVAAELFRAPDIHMALFFAGFMATDPPTSPPRGRDQLVYGVIAATASFVLFVWFGVVFFLLGGLLVANVWEGWRKWRRLSVHRTARHVLPAPSVPSPSTLPSA